MANYMDLLNRSVAKQDAVAAAAQQKKQTLAATNQPMPTPEDFYSIAAGASSGSGAASMNGVEADARTLTDVQMAQKYGADYPAIRQRQVNASNALLADQSATPTAFQSVGDIASSVAGGVANTVGGLASLGLGLASPTAGTAAATGMQKFNEALQGNQSGSLQSARKVNQVINKLDQRDSTLQYDLGKTNDPFVSSLKRIGRDVVDSVGNAASDPAVLTDGVASGIGSMLTAGPLGKAATALSRGVLGARTAMPVAIGAMEAGGAYQQSAAEIMGKSHEQLQKESPYYSEQIMAGKSREEARVLTADRAAKTAAAIQAPLAAAAGTLVSKFEASPLKVPNLMTALGNLGRETLEEGVQSGTGQMSQNIGSKAFANQNQELSEGVGEQVGTGALFGLGTAAAVQAPGVAARGAMASLVGAGNAVKSVAGSVVGALDNGVTALREKNDKASPISDDKIRAATDEATAYAPEAASILKDGIEQADTTPEAKATASEFVDRIMEANAFVDTEVTENPQINPVVRQALAGSTDRLDAMQRSAQLVQDTDLDSQEHAHAAIMLLMLKDQYADLNNADEGALGSLPEGHDSRRVLQEYQALLQNIENTPKLKRGIAKAMEALGMVAETIEPVTEEFLATSAGIENANNAIAVATYAPEKGNLEANKQILLQASKGKLNLNQNQLAALKVSTAILQAAQEADAAVKSAGHTNPKDYVSMQIKTDEIRDKDGTKSAVKHAQGILAAKRAGNDKLATNLLTDFGLFVEHMNNKVTSLNAHLAAGDPYADGVPYLALMPDRKWKPSRKGVFVNTNSPKSIEAAQTIGLEAKTLTDVFNGLTEAFPDLKVGHIAPVVLDSLLAGSIREVATNFRKKVDVAKPDAKSVPEAKQPTPEPVQEAPALPVETPVVQEVVKETPKTEPAVAEDSTVEQDVQTITDEKESQEPVQKTSLSSVYPNLYTIPGKTNYFAEAFKLAKEAKSRLTGSVEPVRLVMDALASNEAFTQVTGDTTRKLDTKISKAYKSYLLSSENLVNDMNTSLQKFLKGKGKGYVDGTKEANKWANGRALNIVDKTENGFEYNPELIEGVALAALQWRLDAEKTVAQLDEQAVASIMGISEDLIDDKHINRLKVGLGILDAKGSLAQKIMSYWGLTSNRNAPRGYTIGIAEALAAEVIQSMVKSGDIEVRNIAWDAEGNFLNPGDAGKFKEMNRFLIKKLPEDSPINSIPDAIDKAVLIKPEGVLYFGSELPSVSDNQLRNPSVKNTKEQKAALTNEQATEHFLNTAMFDAYIALGREGVMELFGNGSLEGKVFNKTHKESLEGQNLNVLAAYDQLMNVRAELENRAAALGMSVDKIPMHYKYEITSVGRLQMMGNYNPQSSKLMREVILPTVSTLDLTTETDRNVYYLALAQALGVKVHQLSVAESVTKVEGILAGMKDAIDSLGSGSVDIPMIKKALGNKPTNVAFHALVDYARLQKSDPSKFTTSLYVEADGVTNGPINAMVLLTAGSFTTDWVKNVAKGGLSLNGLRTLADHFKQDSIDLYKTSTINLEGALQKLNGEIGANAPVHQQKNHLYELMDLFLPDLKFDGKTLALERGIAKNPLTITIYGSGADGIASKITGAVVDSMYERMSELAQGQYEAKARNEPFNVAEAMFGSVSVDSADAQAKFERFKTAYKALTTQSVSKGKNGFYVRQENPTAAGSFNPLEFEVKGADLKNIQLNMRKLFVDPLREAITKTVTPELTYSADLLQKTTQIQSIVLEDVFKSRVANALKNVPKDDVTGFLSDAQLEEIRNEVYKLAPMVQTGRQTFDIAGNVSADVKEHFYGQTFDDTYRTPAFVFGPADAGVSGIPKTVIGMGDGLMMQIISTMRGYPKNTLKIFDGMNMALDTINEDSVLANKAVYESWQGNPLGDVNKSFKVFLSNLDLDGMTPEGRKAVSVALFGPEPMTASTEDMQAEITKMGAELDLSADQVDARHYALSQVKMSVDQMASANAPYERDGIDLSGKSPDQIKDALNEIYNARMVELRSAEPVNEDITPDRVMAIAEIESKIQDNAIARALKKSGVLNDYKVIQGTPEGIYETLPADQSSTGDVQGYINVGEKTIYLGNETQETLVHELIHAASFDAVLAHYTGENKSADVTEAVQRIEDLQTQFMELGIEDSSYVDARSAIISAMTDIELDEPTRKAKALNEFMAWTLANKELSAQLKKTPLARMVKNVAAWIKQLIFGKNIPSSNMLESLVFNTEIIIKAQPSLQARVNQNVLFQSSQFGMNDRLTTMRELFVKKMSANLTDIVTQTTQNRKMSASFATAVRLAHSANAHGFPMSMQEASTFRQIVGVLGTEAVIDPNSMTKVQELYAHVIKNLDVESFMADPTSTHPADRYNAQEKYDFVMGNYLVEADAQGRSTLLPVFLGLAMVNDDFRVVLAKISLPKTVLQKWNTADGILENLGNNFIDSLSNRFSGQGTKAQNVQDAMDAIAQYMSEAAQQEASFIEQHVARVGGLSDGLNDKTVELIDRASDALMAKSEAFGNGTNNKYLKALAQTGNIVAGLATEKNGHVVARKLMSEMNKTDGPKFLFDLMNDLVGRTLENKTIYDMIKAVRVMVQQDRQQYREQLPTIIADKFKSKVTPQQWANLHRAMGATDLASLVDTMTVAEVVSLVQDDAAMQAEIKKLEASLKNKDWPRVQMKAQQLANFMNTGVPGRELLKNAYAVAHLFTQTRSEKAAPTADYIANLDKLITLYSLNTLVQGDKDALSSLAQSEAEGVNFVLSYLAGQRDEEKRKQTDLVRMNSYKGYIPVENAAGMSLIVAEDSEYTSLAEKSFVRVGDYKGSNVDRVKSGRGYYFSPVSGLASFSQGILQNVRETSGGVDVTTGYTYGRPTAGRITDMFTVNNIKSKIKGEVATENLIPVLDEAGEVKAYERSIDPKQLERLKPDLHLAKNIGIWRGRQVEEAKAMIFNKKLVDNLKAMYDEDTKDPAREDEYVNIFANNLNDAVLSDAVRLIPYEVRDQAETLFGKDTFMVRKDMLNDALGYRSASIGDAWSGNSRWSKKTQETVKRLAINAFGNDAYAYTMNGEKTVQNFIRDARVMIVVKSVVVPMGNLMANMYQMVARGIPLGDIAKAMPRKTAEVNAYIKTRVRLVEAEAELRAATDIRKQTSLKREIQTINDDHKRMSIWPLIESGEFASISDAGISRDEILLSEGKLHAYMEKLVNKLPGSLKTAGKYAIVTKDTALFQGMQKAMEYGDFLAKAILYDDLTIRQKKDKAYALGRVTEEFVNYDRLPGRDRGYAESIGLVWFWNFKIRAAKVAVSMIRNNPVHALLATLAPTPDIFGNVGLPTGDNIFAKLADGSLDNSIGFGQALRAPMLNPWYNLVN